MKTVTIQRFGEKYGWENGIVCNCIYAKLKGRGVGNFELVDLVESTYPNDQEKQRVTREMIYRFDGGRAIKGDISRLEALAKKLKMKVVIK